MDLKLKILIFFIALFSCSMLTDAQQQVTREQLMKMFFKANTAVNQNRDKDAIEAFLEIVSCSPNLSDPYMQLGKLYSKNETDVESLKKSVICYDNYLRLNPEAEEKDFIRNEIARIKDLIEVLETPVLAVVPANEDTVQDNVPENVPAEAVTVVGLAADIDFEDEEDVVEEVLPVSVVPADSVMAQSDSVIISRPVAEVRPEMIGRWSSLAQRDNGRDLWIIDILAERDTMWLCVLDSSYIIEKNNLTDAVCKVPGFADGEMVSFEMELRRNIDNAGDLSDFDMALNNMFGISNDTDTVGDTVGVHHYNSYKLYKYGFKLKSVGKNISGSLYKSLYDSSSDIESDTITETVDLYKVPENYNGYYFPMMSEEEKAMKLEFRDIFNRKIKESAKSVSSVNDLGCLYANGIGTRKNMKMAVSYFTEASMKNNLFAMLNLADLCLRGLGTEKNVDKARELYNKAFEAGYTDAMVMCGDTYMEGDAGQEPDYEKAISCYQQAILKNCPYAAYRLGWIYCNGIGVEKDIEKAINYYEKAISMNYEDAMVDLGILYREGEIVQKNERKAMEYLLKASDRGSESAMYELYMMYMTGDGVELNYNLAGTWLSKYMKKMNFPFTGFSTLKSEINAVINK